MHRIAYLFVYVVLGASISACEIVEGIGSARVVKDEVGFVFDASERFVYTHNGVTCSEAPPDVLVSTLNEFKTTARVDVPGVGGGEGSFEYKLDEDAEKIFSRSQTLQYFRDATHRLCQSHSNKVIEKPEYRKSLDTLMRRVEVMLIATECRGKGAEKTDCIEALGKFLERATANQAEDSSPGDEPSS